MLVAPRMGPIVEFGFSFAVFDQRQLRHSLKTIAVGAVLAVGLSAIIVALSPLAQATTEIMARTRPTLLDLLVAVFSAAAGGYATVRRKSDTLVGVAKSEEHTSELQSLMRNSSAVFCLKKKKNTRKAKLRTQLQK